MKEFIEALKKHYGAKPYLVPDAHPGGSGTRFWAIYKDDPEFPWQTFDTYQWDGSKEDPVTAFWCLDEIERLGWENVLLGAAGNYEISCDKKISDEEIRDIGLLVGKTRTEVCMSALVAVLEAK